jgi:hypothetical protein
MYSNPAHKELAMRKTYLNAEQDPTSTPRDAQGRKYIGAPSASVQAIVEAFDSLLQEHGLELIIAEGGDSNIWMSIVKPRRELPVLKLSDDACSKFTIRSEAAKAALAAGWDTEEVLLLNTELRGKDLEEAIQICMKRFTII